MRCVGSGPSESAEDLARLSRAVLAETVVRRGSEPHPPREPLPIVLPPVLADQVAAAQQQIFAEAEAGAQPAAPEVPAADDPEGVSGGALDQVAHATVYGENSYTEAPAEGGSGGHDDPSVTADPDPEDDAPLPPSSGSAMQRFFRRR